MCAGTPSVGRTLLCCLVGLTLAACATPTTQAGTVVRTSPGACSPALSAFADRVAASPEVAKFRKRTGIRPTLEVAPTRGLSASEGILLRHCLIRAFLSHKDTVALVIGPGPTRRSTSRERYYLMRHGQSTNVPLPGHVRPADFVIFSEGGTDPHGRPWIGLTAVRLADNQIVRETEVPALSSFPDKSEAGSRHERPRERAVRFQVISDLSGPVGVWIHPGFPTNGMAENGPVPPDLPPSVTLLPGKSSFSGRIWGKRRGTVRLCLQSILYRNVCRIYGIPYSDGTGKPIEITGVGQYGFLVVRAMHDRAP